MRAAQLGGKNKIFYWTSLKALYHENIYKPKFNFTLFGYRASFKYNSTWASLTLIRLFLEMLKFSIKKNFRILFLKEV